MRNLAIMVVLGLASLLVGGPGVAVIAITVVAPLAFALAPRTNSRYAPRPNPARR
jgi:hypothetical protein